MAPSFFGVVNSYLPAEEESPGERSEAMAARDDMVGVRGIWLHLAARELYVPGQGLAVAALGESVGLEALDGNALLGEPVFLTD